MSYNIKISYIKSMYICIYINNNVCIYVIYIIDKAKKIGDTKKKYPIKHKLNCECSIVIYLATCQRCQGHYCGKSQTPFKKRHSNRKQEVKNQIRGLGHHYGGQGCGYANLRIMLIDQVENENL